IQWHHSFIGFMAIALFSLFFFYRDGQSFIKRLVNLSPLSNNLDHFILRRFAALSNVLTVSVLGVAMIQGLAFSLLMLVFGLPWLFLGLAFAITSFIPVVGGLLVWGPVVLYFLIEGSPWLALITALYSAVFIGIVIDNLLRTVLIQRLSQQYRQDAGRNALDHTWLTLLSTFAGLLHFGMMGLIFGPMLAAMAITIFDVYEHKHRHQLDYS
ncbi:MAG TPA: AI-2E family transporter, partial [Thiotrichales bacterium]|nr:AI-2E family transporter [Thiotrichales bacterium]